MPRRPPPSRSPRARRSAYHHGHLREALVAAALGLAEERGLEGLTVREVARRERVSPGAPFRHFASREELLAAAAAEAVRRLRREVEQALARAPRGDALAGLRAMGGAYLRWARENPAHFRIVDQAGAGPLAAVRAPGGDDHWIRDTMAVLVARAQRRGQVRRADPALVQLTARALVYGLSRMLVDGQLPRWGVPEAAFAEAAERAVGLLVQGLAPRRRRPPARRAGGGRPARRR